MTNKNLEIFTRLLDPGAFRVVCKWRNLVSPSQTEDLRQLYSAIREISFTQTNNALFRVVTIAVMEYFFVVKWNSVYEDIHNLVLSEGHLLQKLRLTTDEVILLLKVIHPANVKEKTKLTMTVSSIVLREYVDRTVFLTKFLFEIIGKYPGLIILFEMYFRLKLAKLSTNKPHLLAKFLNFDADLTKSSQEILPMILQIAPINLILFTFDIGTHIVGKTEPYFSIHKTEYCSRGNLALLKILICKDQYFFAYDKPSLVAKGALHTLLIFNEEGIADKEIQQSKPPSALARRGTTSLLTSNNTMRTPSQRVEEPYCITCNVKLIQTSANEFKCLKCHQRQQKCHFCERLALSSKSVQNPKCLHSYCSSCLSSLEHVFKCPLPGCQEPLDWDMWKKVTKSILNNKDNTQNPSLAKRMPNCLSCCASLSNDLADLQNSFLKCKKCPSSMCLKHYCLMNVCLCFCPLCVLPFKTVATVMICTNCQFKACQSCHSNLAACVCWCTRCKITKSSYDTHPLCKSCAIFHCQTCKSPITDTAMINKCGHSLCRQCDVETNRGEQSVGICTLCTSKKIKPSSASDHKVLNEKAIS